MVTVIVMRKHREQIAQIILEKQYILYPEKCGHRAIKENKVAKIPVR